LFKLLKYNVSAQKAYYFILESSARIIWETNYDLNHEAFIYIFYVGLAPYVNSCGWIRPAERRSALHANSRGNSF